MSNTVNEIYDLREKFIIIGLTGKFESGCTTVAKIMEKMCSSDKERMLKLYSNRVKRNDEISDCEKAIRIRKYEIICEYSKSNKKDFIVVDFNKIVLLLGVHNLTMLTEQMTEAIDEETSIGFNDNLPQSGDTMHLMPTGEEDQKIEEKIKGILGDNKTELEDYFVCCKKEIIDNKNKLQKLADNYKGFNRISSNILKKLEQVVGDKYKLELMLNEWAYQLRETGYIYCYYPLSDETRKRLIKESSKNNKFDVSWIIAYTINNFIKVIRHIDKEGRAARIIIDKFINPHEILFLRERYSTFFLVAVNHDSGIRKPKVLLDKKKEEKINGVLTREEKDNNISNSFLKSWRYLRTDINTCITLADIHINNNASRQQLSIKLLPYYALILHPGLIQPTNIERIMQLAYTASLSSGCLSRQVGAVVTNRHYSVKAVGWNSVPDGQMPCTLRNFMYMGDSNYNFSQFFSNYENRDERFSDHCALIRNKYKQTIEAKSFSGLPLLFCFKDIYTGYSQRNSGNQVHTRSLHAEENAFLQLAKYGSTGIENGILFTTDQCCVLCAKKAYQLGIRKIYYIDPYDDIAPTHILKCPDNPFATIPKLIRYEGAVGPAYSKIYMPYFSQKDEICCRLGLDMKDVSRECYSMFKHPNEQSPPNPNESASDDKQ